jgi:hypothetical protein
MSYIILKLATGHEIIGHVLAQSGSNHDADYWTLGDPFEIKSQWGPQGDFQMGLVPFMPYAEGNEVSFQKYGVVSCCRPVGNLVKEYTKQTSGIIIP